MNKNLLDVLRKTRTTPAFARIEHLYRSFSYTGKLLLAGLIVVAVVSVAAILWQLNNKILTTVPAVGGVHIEGIIGTPRFINPILAVSSADRDLTALVFSGLMRADASGNLVPDIASSVEASDDGLTYTAIIDDRARFHDGTPITADDVVFTVMKAQDPALKSPQRANWEGVGVERVDAHTVVFKLKSPYAPFLENLTMGILPALLWSSIGSDEFPFSFLNTSPVGNGLYKVVRVTRDDSGIPKEYELRRNGDYVRKPPYIGTIKFRFYQSDQALVDAWKSGNVDAVHNIAPALAHGLPAAALRKTPLPRIFGVFFNQNEAPIFTHPEVRLALTGAAPRDRIINEVLGGFGSVVESPLPPALLPSPEGMGSGEEKTAAARTLLEKAGWKRNTDSGFYEKKTKGKTETLRFTLATANVPDLRKTAELLRSAWGEIGVSVEIKIFEQGDLSQLVIRPRKYDALLFGEVVGRELDLFAFWHSSQRNDPGLNIALYANGAVDKLLADLRTRKEAKERLALAERAAAAIEKDAPAVFLYAPHFIYVFPKKVGGLSLGTITTPSERFLNVADWYIETDRVWRIFARGR